MKAVFSTLVLTLAGAGPVLADGAAAVRATPAVRGDAPVMVTAFGEVAPASQSLRSLSLMQQGQVTDVFVTAGQAVKRGQPLLRFCASASAAAAYQQAQSAVALARSQRVHTQVLLSQKLATRDQAAAADKALADAESQLSALRRDGAAQSTTVLKAPADGLVVSLPATPGDRPVAGAVLVTVAPASALQVSLGVEPGWRSQIRIGQAATLSPVGGGPSVMGRIVRVDAALNPKTRLVDVDVSAPQGAVLSGQAFRASIAVGRKSGWLVPHGAVEIEGDKAFLFQLNAGKAVRVDVDVLLAGRQTDVVAGPLEPSRPVVAVGAYQLEDGAAVRVVQ